MPPYDEQTQAFIDGKCSLGGLGGREPCPYLPLWVPKNQHPPDPPVSQRGWGYPGVGVWGLWGPVPPHQPCGPIWLLTGCCLFVPPSRAGSEWRHRAQGPDPLGAKSLGSGVGSVAGNTPRAFCGAFLPRAILWGVERMSPGPPSHSS